DQIQQTGLETRGFLIWDLDTVPELAPYVPDEVRSRYEAYRADKVALAVPAEEIYGEAFWMPTFQKLQGSGTLDSP
ncbi:MAG: hypothetical protein Q8O63_11535, partial [Hoeflea sp.]|nr:hypothetical protein [Hoeflea sp.]